MHIDGKRILVTGGCGLIGSTTIDLLLREHQPEQIVILDNLARGSLDNVESSLKDPRVSLVRSDIRDADVVRRATEGMDAVFHMAALRITACAADPREAMQVMCDGSFNVVDAAQRAGVEKLVAASSASIYGMADHFPTREDHHPYNNQTWYGASKVMLEGLLRSYRAMHGLPYTALRYFNVYGPRMDIHGKYTEVLIRWMERIDAGEPPLIFGDGLQTMDFIYIDDIARANVLALQSDSVDDVFNVASGIETSLRGLAAALNRVMGGKLEPEHGPERSVNPVARRLASIEKAQRVLGFRATVGLDEGLERLVRWWQQSSDPALHSYVKAPSAGRATTARQAVDTQAALR
jgi:UDP-glucose 4-epimerase